MTRTTSLAGRAALAIALMIAYYLLALGVSFGLLWLAYLDLTRTQSPAYRLILFCVVGAGSVLWAILPRRDRFEPPGPRLAPEEQPELFALIGEVARATEQEMPADVYLMNDVNAFVAQRDGLMGIGSRRVMGLGLPLMQALTVDEFKGVLTHEFGHYHGGDVALGPWIHKTQAAILRTIVQLGGNVLRFIFIAFARLFFRVTHAVSRRQEFVADELAAGVVGSQVMASGLRKVNVAAMAYPSYWQSEVAPVFQAGYRPPIIDGFRRYAASPTLSQMFAMMAAEHEANTKTEVYDTHPSLADRVAALDRQPSRASVDARPATALLRNIAACEAQLCGAISLDLADLKPLDWSSVSDEVYLPMWHARVAQHGALLRAFTTDSPPATDADLQAIGKGIAPGASDPSQRRGMAAQLIVAAYALALGPLGWTVDTAPGDEVVLRRGADEFRPYSELAALVAGKTSMEAWHARCAALGIAAMPLGAASGLPAEAR